MHRYELKPNRLKLLGAIALAIVALAFLMVPSGSAGPAGGAPTVSVSTIQVGLGGQGTASLVVSNVPPSGVAAWTVDISYNGGIVSVVDCTGLVGGICNQNFGDQLMRVAGSTGMSGANVSGAR